MQWRITFVCLDYALTDKLVLDLRRSENVDKYLHIGYGGVKCWFQENALSSILSQVPN